MEKKNALVEVLRLCKLGKFKESLKILYNIREEISNKWITSLIISCCSTCVANTATPENISENDLYSFLTHIASYIKCMNESDSLSYLQSIFHILKFFVQTDNFMLLANMDSILLPSFLPSSLPRKQSVTYESSASLLHNFIVKADNREFETLIKIYNTISKMYARVSNASALFTTSLNCAIKLSGLSCPLEYLETYYFNVLSLVKLHNMEVNSEETLRNFKSFLSFFTLIYSSMFKKFEFKKAAKFHERTMENLTETFNDDCTSVLILLKFPLALAPINFEGKSESVKEFNKSLSNLDSVKKQLIGNKLYNLIYTVVFCYYKSVGRSEWNKVSDSLQLELLQFLWDVSRIDLLPKYTCSCKCLIEKNVYQAFSYSQLVSTLLEISARQKNSSKEFNKKSANLLTRFGEDVKTLREYNCEKWKKAWETLGMALYNIAVHLYKNSREGYLHYFYNMIKRFIKFEVPGAETILKPSIVGSTFTVLCDSSKDHRHLMAVSALAIKLCPSQRDIFMVSWIKTKVRQRDAKTSEGDEVQKLTLVGAFKCLKNEMEVLTGGANVLTAADRIDLLIYELEQYKLKWKSKIPMMCTLKELCDLAEVIKIVGVIVTVFGDCELMLHDDVPKMLQRILKQYEEKLSGMKNVSLESTLLLAFLYYMHYKYCVKDVIAKNTDDMERTMSIAPKTEEPPDAIPKDPNEKCDIVSFYDSLKLTRYFAVMKNLNKSLDLFASAIKDDSNMSGSGQISHSMLYNTLMKISFEYRLHRNTVKSLQALQTALRVALSVNNARYIVWTVAFIIESSDVKKSYVKHLSSIADRHLEDMERASVQDIKVVLTYYICKAKALLYDDYKEAYRIFQVANELYDAQEDKSELRLVKSQLHLLHFKFVLKPCQLGVVDHMKSSLLTVHLANTTVYEVYNTSKLDGPYEMSLLLNTNEELARLYHFLQCPREVRAYCKEIIILAQHLVLPLQCAYYLVYLAHADLRSSRYDDCQVKVQGLADILCLSKSAYYLQEDQENKPPPVCAAIENDVVDITNDMQEMVLDLPVPKVYKKQFSPSSPTLVVPSFHLPAFVHHGDGCDCFYCTSLEYQKLALEKIRLDALLNVKQCNDAISGDFYHGAINLYEQCSRKYDSYTGTVARLISCDLIPDFNNELLEAYGFTLLNYSSYLMRAKSKTEALKVTDKLIDLASRRKVQHIYLYNEALFQKLSYITELPAVVPIEDKTLEMDSLCPTSNVVSRTPESKQSKVTFSYSPTISPPKTRVKKCLAFNLSPSEGVPNVSRPKEKTSPLSTQPKTPAPKIKIYSFDAEQKPKSTSKKANDKRKMAVYKDPCPSIVPNGATGTPVAFNPADTESSLRTRTRLLTNKLRQSSKKAEAPKELDKVEGVDGLKRPSLRKNLFEQGEAGTLQGGAVRKSTRSKKV